MEENMHETARKAVRQFEVFFEDTQLHQEEITIISQLDYKRKNVEEGLPEGTGEYEIQYTMKGTENYTYSISYRFEDEDEAINAYLDHNDLMEENFPEPEFAFMDPENVLGTPFGGGNILI